MYSSYMAESKNKYILYFFFSNLFYFLSLKLKLLELRESFKIVFPPKSRQETFFIILKHKQFLFLDQINCLQLLFLRIEKTTQQILCAGENPGKSFHMIQLFSLLTEKTFNFTVNVLLKIRKNELNTMWKLFYTFYVHSQFCLEKLKKRQLK